jgi:hypothetical protein
MSDNNLATRPHAPFGFSRLPALQACPGFLNSEGTSPAAQRGTDIGEELAAWLVDGTETTIDDPAVKTGRGLIASIISGNYDSYSWSAEDRLTTSIDGVWGYADLVGRSPWEERAVLLELKTGYGDRAPANRNRQVQGLALALLEQGRYVVDAYLIECDKGTVSGERFTTEDIPVLQTIVRGIVDSAREPLLSSFEPAGQCRYCARATTCPSLAEAPGKALAHVPKDVAPKEWAAALSPEAAAETLSRVSPLVKLADDLLGALKARVTSLIEAGAEVPGWRIKETAGTRSWTDEAEVLDYLSAHFGLEDVTALASPAQVEKLGKTLGKEAKKALREYIKGHTTTSTRKSLEEG